MQKIIILFILSIFSLKILAQEWGIRTGFNAFAPIPSQLDSAAKGSISPFLYAGGYAKWNFAKHFSLQLGMNYNRKAAGYEAPIPQAETTVLITVFGGQQQLVNASYRGDVKGKMGLHYLDIPLQLTGTWGRWQAQIGSYYSRVLAGQDTGTVHIIIGNPGVEFSRDTVIFNNFALIRKNTLGIVAGIKYQFPMGLFIETHIMRSLQPLYNKAFMQSRPENNQALYMTGMQLGLGYRWNMKKWK